MNKKELKLLNIAKKSESLLYRFPFILYLLPLMFVLSNVYFFIKIRTILKFKDLTVTINPSNFEVIYSLFVAFFSVLFIFIAWIIVKLWNERRIFYGIIQKLQSPTPPKKEKPNN